MNYSKTNSHSTQEQYSTPKCKAVVLKVEGMLCGSYGEAGRAGKGFDGDNTGDYGEDF